jgi:anhydro-N-acetylmuramic acid kinase
MKLIEEKTNCKITIPNELLINYKEALIFAFLGVLRINNEVNVLSFVTGAKKNHSSGSIIN